MKPMNPTLKKVLIYGGGALVGLVVLKKIGPGLMSKLKDLLNFSKGSSSEAGPSSSAPSLPPIRVTAGQKSEAATFQYTSSKVRGAAYSVAKLLGNGHVEFTPAKTGFFTRNIVRQGSLLLAEVR